MYLGTVGLLHWVKYMLPIVPCIDLAGQWAACSPLPEMGPQQSSGFPEIARGMSLKAGKAGAL